MATLPLAADIASLDVGHTQAELAAELGQVVEAIRETAGGSAQTTLTIASGALVPPLGAGGAWHLVDTEGAASTDDVTAITMTNCHVGRRVRFSAANSGRVVTFVHGSNIVNYDGADFVLDATDKWIEYLAGATDMVEIDRYYGTDHAEERLALGVPKQIGHNTLCPHRNLAGAWATNATATWTADELVLEDASGNQVAIAAFNKTANIATSGAGGLDTGSEGSSTHYYAWAIAKADGTQSIILSTSTTVAGLTFPSGYTYAGLIGWVRNNASSNFIDFKQLGALVDFDVVQILTAGVATSDTSLNAGSGTVTALSTIIPALARKVQGYARVSDSGSSASAITIKPVTGSNVGRKIINNPGGTTAAAGGYFEALMVTPQTLYYQVSAGDSGEIFVTGLEF